MLDRSNRLPPIEATAFMPMTWPAELTRGPPESPERSLASIWTSSLYCDGFVRACGV
jgi:hypothetical protein